MMWAFAPSDATASDASTTSGLGSAVVWVVVVNEKIALAVSNSFYVVFYLIVVHIPNFIQIRKKRIEAKKICYRSALVGWPGQ